MAGEKDFERRLETIERGIRELEATADAGLRAAVQQLVQSILELHGRSLERLLEIVRASGPSGADTVDQLGRDPIVSHLLLLHSLHPLALETRVQQAIDGVRPALRSKRADVQLLSIVEGAVRVRLLGGPEQKAAVERAILDAAPDVAAVEIEGAVDSVVGFVSLESLRVAEPPRLPTPHLPPIALTRGA